MFLETMHEYVGEDPATCLSPRGYDKAPCAYILSLIPTMLYSTFLASPLIIDSAISPPLRH